MATRRAFQYGARMGPRDGYHGNPGEPELKRLGEVLAECFAFPVSDAPGIFTNAGAENTRTFSQGGEVVGGLILLPMGQFFGGRSVKMGGFAAVGVASHARGRGIATQLMEAGLRDLDAQGFALAGLYPATQTLYRKVGFEQAGARYDIKGPLWALPRGSRELPMRPLRGDDLPVVQRLYTEQARHTPGYLDRGRYIWNRVQNLRGTPASGYVVEERGEVTGYAFVIRNRKPNFHYDLMLTDWGAKTPGAMRRLIEFFRDHGSMAEDLTFYGSESSPLLLMLEEPRFTATVNLWWMTRILDVIAALTARGYPALPHTELHLEVRDELFRKNNGRFVLEVSGGEARVSPGGTGALSCDIRALVPLYTGHRSASALAGIGAISATADALATANALFAGPAPSIADMY